MTELIVESQIPTVFQQRLLKSYIRTMGWCGALSILVLLVAAINVAKGSNQFGSLAMFAEVLLALLLAVPVLITWRLRKRLLKNIENESVNLTRRFPWWASLSLVFGLTLIASFANVLLVHSQEPTREEAHSAAVAKMQSDAENLVVNLQADDFQSYCVTLSDPSTRAGFISGLMKILQGKPDVANISDLEINEIYVSVFMKACGIN